MRPFAIKRPKLVLIEICTFVCVCPKATPEQIDKAAKKTGIDKEKLKTVLPAATEAYAKYKRGEKLSSEERATLADWGKLRKEGKSQQVQAQSKTPEWKISDTKPKDGGQVRVTGTKDGKEIKVDFHGPRYDVNTALTEGRSAYKGLGKKAESAVASLTPNPNNLHMMNHNQILTNESVDSAQLFLSATRKAAKNGDTVALNLSQKVASDFNKTLGDNDRFTPIKSSSGVLLLGRYRDGNVEPVAVEEIKRKTENSDAARSLREKQIESAIGSEKDRDVEADFAAKLAKVEDAWVGRKPTPGSVPSADEYKKKAEDWAKSQGFTDGGVNGFTAEATKAHDIAHPVTHDLIGMDSAKINKTLGSLKGVSGKPSLVAEEAVVNIVEHLSRGDSLHGSILNGVRLARVQSRDPKFETDETRTYVRSKEFKDKLSDLADTIFKNDNFSEYMKIVRESNQISGTVQFRGDDFTSLRP